MKTKYECIGGTVVREGEKKWLVFAPDGRPVGRFPTRQLALAKAEHWDKWDAFNSVAEMFANMAPFSFLLTAQCLLTIGEGKDVFIPTAEQMTKAGVLDTILHLLSKLKAEGKVDNEKIKEILMEVAQKLFSEEKDAEITNPLKLL